MNEQWIVNLLCSVIGGLLALGGAYLTYFRQNKDKEQNASGVLYFELKFIENYFQNDHSSLTFKNLREWQKIAIACSFFNEKQLKYIFYIFKNADVFHEEFSDNHRNKENLNSTTNIKSKMFKKSDQGFYTNEYTEEYKLILDVLKKHMSSNS